MTEKDIVNDMRAAGEKDQPGERWALIKLLPTHAVSTHGRIYALTRTLAVRTRRGSYNTERTGRIISPFIGADGLKVRLAGEGARYVGSVGRLVLLTFVGDPPEDMGRMVPIHLDKNIYNNRLDNLCWGTAFLAERIDTAKRMVEVGLAGGTLEDAEIKTGISAHHCFEIALAIRKAVGGEPKQAWAETARMFQQQPPDLKVVLCSTFAIQRAARRKQKASVADAQVAA